KASEKETIYVVVTEDKLKDTIASLEKEGWIFEGMALNRDRTWTVIMSKWNNNKSPIKNHSDDIIGDKIPDGVYHIDSYLYQGRLIKVELTIKDGKEVSRKKILDD
ncbi:MAG: hypothetical protein Q4Q06_06210, partial [Bacteroidota bacterium]|nr:hypothetical protein [Bacteroidota bacterium]